MPAFATVDKSDLGNHTAGVAVVQSSTTTTGPYRLAARRGHRVALSRHSRSPDPTDLEEVRSWLSERPHPWAIDLFCGAGGLSLGLEEAGFSVVVAADSDPLAIETHSANIEGLTWTGDLSDPNSFIEQLRKWGIDRVDLLAGGPPCQPFSFAGVSKISDLVKGGQRAIEDERADLWMSFFAVVDYLKPRAVLFENVPGFTAAQDGAVLVALVDQLKSRGYDVHADVVEAWKYGVPQHRLRLFVVGTVPDVSFKWPKSRTHQRPTLREAIGDLPNVPPDERNETQVYEGPPTSLLARKMRRGLRGHGRGLIHDHVTRAVRPDDAKIYRLLKPGDTYLDVPEGLRRYRSDIFSDKYYRLSYDDVSRTITAHIARDGYWYIHPEVNRTLSIREAARVQTFPDRFRFAGYPSSRFRQIGNAVPPLLASAIATAVKNALNKKPASAARETDHTRGRTHSFRDEITGWIQRNERHFPWRVQVLTPWQVLLTEMCLHRTRAEQVARVAEELLNLGATPRSFLENITRLNPVLATLGLGWRRENLVSAATFVEEQLSGRVPDSWQRLRMIPGVGDYIASAVICFAFRRPSVLLDTNTRRIARRVLGLSQGGSTWRLRLALLDMAGDAGADTVWNKALLDLGALVCTAHTPKCENCPVKMHCATGREK